MKNFKFKSGENLSYEDLGSDFKDVLVYHHPLMIFPQNTLINFCEKNQIRLVLIYRSGHFDSSLFSADDSFLKLALRSKELFKALNLSEFSVLGESVGAAYAYATAVACGEEAKKVFILSGFNAPPELLTSYSDYVHIKEIYDFALRNTPENTAQMAWEKYGSQAKGALKEAIKAQLNGIGFDLWLQARPWGFELKDVSQSVLMYHSRADEEVPFAVALQVSRMLPNCELIAAQDTPHHSAKALLDFLKIIKERL
ncbi:alpha/beta fold hydrolase [Campylobacter concisus]|uniref:alpha/beta fold hydrolase n=1 Tax=Campylobacter concisus TaxID=199 RepID=UPI000D313AF8|nr:alpha/beta hydrolase [Campylobacter concisus]